MASRKFILSSFSNSFPNHSNFTRATVPQVSLDTSAPAMLDGLDFSRILFLDVDGVLHPSDYVPKGGESIQPFQSAAHLEQALNEADPGHWTPIVICSDWKLDTPLQKLRSHFSADIARRIVGVTPDMLSSGGTRATEVKAWMALHAPEGKWLAIDDRPNWYGDDKNKVFDVPGKERGGPGELDARLARELASRLVQFLKPTEPGAHATHPPGQPSLLPFGGDSDKARGLFSALDDSRRQAAAATHRPN